MIAACPKCSARYRVDGERLAPGGSRLRCTRCRAVFRVSPPAAPVTQDESAPAAGTPAKPAAVSASVAPQNQPQPAVKPAASSGGNYFLQSGTFNTMDQAERLKAQLTLLGLGASVQKLTINKNTIHRVRVGPYRDYTSLNQARALMRQHGIQSTPVMIRK